MGGTIVYSYKHYEIFFRTFEEKTFFEGFKIKNHKHQEKLLLFFLECQNSTINTIFSVLMVKHIFNSKIVAEKQQAIRQARASRHHGSPIKEPPESPPHHGNYAIEGFKRV